MVPRPVITRWHNNAITCPSRPAGFPASDGGRWQVDPRAKHHVPATEIDDKLSDACSKHARYLRLNKWTGLGNPHFEIKGRRGFTPEGHRAGMMSVILWGSHTSAVPGHWITYYHRFSFLHPLLRGVGISDGTPSISI